VPKAGDVAPQGYVGAVRSRRRPFQHLKDLILAPLRLVLLPDDVSVRLGLTSLEEERINAALPHLSGRLLDIGAGRNSLVKAYGNGVGVDVYDWGGGALIVPDTSRLPFPDKSFHTVTLLACLNHIPYRQAVLREAWRVLPDGGRLIITMIDPITGLIGHKLWWYSEEKTRGMSKGEVYGLWTSQVRDLCEAAGFAMVAHTRFVYGLNNLYVAQKRFS
jgi:SAM-dependent methyltransferase